MLKRATGVPLRKPVGDHRIGGGEQRHEHRAETERNDPAFQRDERYRPAMPARPLPQNRKIAHELQRPADQEPSDRHDIVRSRRLSARRSRRAQSSPMPNAATSPR